MMLPIRDEMSGTTIWKQRSLKCAEEKATATEPKNATPYGGAVSNRVIVLLFPSVLRMLGRKYVIDWPVVL